MESELDPRLDGVLREALAPEPGAVGRIAARALAHRLARSRAALGQRLAAVSALLAAVAFGAWLSGRPLGAPAVALLANRGAILVLRDPRGGVPLVRDGAAPPATPTGSLFILHGGTP